MIRASVVMCCAALMWAALAGAASRKPPGPVSRAASPAPAPPNQLVVLWELKSLGLDEETARAVIEDLGRAIGKVAGFVLLPEAQVRQILQQKNLSPAAPLARIGEALGAAFLLTGSLGGMAGEVSLDLKLQDARTGEPVRRVVVAISGAGPARLSAPSGLVQGREAALAEAMVRLLAPERWVGALTLEGMADGAQVHLDGEMVATTPLAAPLGGLSPGKHILRITKEGFKEISQFVLIRYGQVTPIRMALADATVTGSIQDQRPADPPKVPSNAEPRVVAERPRGVGRGLTWSALGLGAALGGTGFVLAVATDQGVDRNRILATLLITSGGVLLLGSLVFLLFPGGTDATLAGSASGLTLSPAVLPGGAGLGLAGFF